MAAGTNRLGIYSGVYEWELRDYAYLKNKQSSDVFELGTYFWQLLCYPNQGQHPQSHMSLYLEYPFADRTPARLCPKASFRITVKNHSDPEKNIVRASNEAQIFAPGRASWGHKQFMPIADANVSSGYLRADGVLVIRVELCVERQRKRPRDLGGDFLALLADPGPTSDITLVACDRPFRLHRTILAARCSFFKTLFAGEFSDSGVRELPLPDTDPDALELLLRYIYGDVLSCPPELLKPASELADRWLLNEAKTLLQEQIGHASTASTVVKDLLWAYEHGTEALLAKLEALYVFSAANVSEVDAAKLAARNPRLMGRLHVAVARASAKKLY